MPVPAAPPEPALNALCLPPLDLDRPAAAQIYGALKAAILDMTLPPGSRIPETEIGARVGASRTPVREAFGQLRDDGLIVTWPSRGTYVTRLSADRVRSAQFLREALEVAVMERLAEAGLRPEDRARVVATLEDQERAVTAGDRAGFQSADDRFHAALADATALDRVKTLLVREKAALDRLRVLSLTDADHMARLLQDHRGILAALDARDPGRAVAATRAHLRRVLGTLSTLAAAHGDYFD